MTRKFEKKIKELNIIDTRKYRYVFADDGIMRIDRDALGTTSVLSMRSDLNPYGWEYIRKF